VQQANRGRPTNARMAQVRDPRFTTRFFGMSRRDEPARFLAFLDDILNFRSALRSPSSPVPVFKLCLNAV